MDDAGESRWAGRAAYGAAALFVVSLARFFVIPHLGLPADSPLVAELNGGLLPASAHLLLLPVVAAVPAPTWARAAGYGWLVIDVTTAIMALNGVADAVYLPTRYGGHVAAAVWIATASWRARGVTRTIGALLALNLGGFSLVPHAPVWALLPTGPLLPLWFGLVGRRLAPTTAKRQVPEEGAHAA